MPENVLQVGPQIFSIVIGTFVFLGAAIVFAFKYRAVSARKAGERGHRPAEEIGESEQVSPDGFIDTFAGVVSEAGGSMSFTGWLIMGVTLVSYFIYLFVYWKQ